MRQGYGSDYLRISALQRQEFLKYWWLGNIFFPVTSYLYKTSVLLLNKRIFVQKPFQIICWCVFGINTCWFVGNWFALLLECLPIPSMWGAAVATKCIAFDAVWISLVSWSEFQFAQVSIETCTADGLARRLNGCDHCGPARSYDLETASQDGGQAYVDGTILTRRNVRSHQMCAELPRLTASQRCGVQSHDLLCHCRRHQSRQGVDRSLM